MEKYMAFSFGTKTDYYDKEVDKSETKVLHELTFIDSLQFMSSSLYQLIGNLKIGKIDKFEYTNPEFEENTEVTMIKGMYP